jgi:CRISPR/Cas system CMR subunit Cmr4 (Cas7 group RAMP superfamily)
MLVEINYELQFAAPFHFGTGITAGAVDRTVIRDSDDALYVPASTFKGVVREHCEHLCRLYLPNEQVASPHNRYATLLQFGKAPSIINRIFGSPLYPGGPRFNDARQDPTFLSRYKNVQTGVLTQVRIDRLTRTAVDKALYTSEFGAPYLFFRGSIKGLLDCIPVEELAVPVAGEETSPLTPSCSLLILLAGLLMVERLGGNKSTGKGQCRCTITNLLLDGQTCTEEQWQGWIERMDILQKYQSDEGGGQA